MTLAVRIRILLHGNSLIICRLNCRTGRLSFQAEHASVTMVHDRLICSSLEGGAICKERRQINYIPDRILNIFRQRRINILKRLRGSAEEEDVNLPAIRGVRLVVCVHNRIPHHAIAARCIVQDCGGFAFIRKGEGGVGTDTVSKILESCGRVFRIIGVVSDTCSDGIAKTGWINKVARIVQYIGVAV